MVFLAGLRRVGKTTLAHNIPGAAKGYLNWDVPLDRERIMSRDLPPARLWVFDEIHKYRSRRNYLKGLLDGREVDFIVTQDGEPRLAVECKQSDAMPSDALWFFAQRFADCDAWQISARGKKGFVTADGIRVCHAVLPAGVRTHCDACQQLWKGVDRALRPSACPSIRLSLRIGRAPPSA